MIKSVKTIGRRGVINAGRTAIRGFGMATATWRPDPDFLLIGAKRGGSTSFYFDLITHPQVALLFPRPDRLPKAAATKGIHYFDSNYYRSRRWYASHLPSARARQHQTRQAGGPVVTGEGSPYYLTHPAAAERVARDLASVKLLAVLRDPVLRTHSHWKERVREGQESLPFLDAVEQESSRVGNDAERLRQDPHFYSYPHEQQSYLEQSRYGAALERWFEHFPRSSFLLIKSEDYYADPGSSLNQAAEFLGIEPGRFGHGEPQNAAPGSPLDDDTRLQVEALLRDDAKRLRELTGLTWDWV
ncbi:sulfotransferase domain-containing protein [Microlunatus elymi]|uniref:Sulfotransferase domain-containing protein n=1 Tax=Microlunatus elymi TaxID=2596828 RepID=A0A516PVF4_9ACTN|nr:sulfotransferase domain-containing protein [Microlunatus elymi]QDP95174.1 sulfotransferase domain-containing protein [Microlunatus elymi]